MKSERTQDSFFCEVNKLKLDTQSSTLFTMKNFITRIIIEKSIFLYNLRKSQLDLVGTSCVFRICVGFENEIHARML
jgi:hypothetical protein